MRGIFFNDDNLEHIVGRIVLAVVNSAKRYDHKYQKSVKFSVITGHNYDISPKVMEKIPQTEIRYHNLHQTDFVYRIPRSQKYGFQRGSVRTICLCKDLSRTVNGVA